MADLLTVYDDDQANTFIDCTICDKKIRGETQYKIHVTTLQHLKKEEALVAQGRIPRTPPLPQWTDIKEYLQYLNLDEPIIGLSPLVQIPDLVTEDGKTVLKYKCRLCVVEMDLFGMVAHVVGRKHRQKYLELKRPDLVTWQDNAQKQPGLVAKAKAAVVEKQEGWGTPEPLKRPQEKSRNVYQAGSDSRSRVYEQPYFDRDSQRQSPLVEEIHRQPYLDENRFGRPYFSGEKNDHHDRPNPGDAIRHQSYPEDGRHHRPYAEPDVRGFLRRDQREVHAGPYVDQRSGRRPPSEEGYEEVTLGRRQYSSGDGHRLAPRDYDVQENVLQDGVPRNRHNDKDFRIHSAAQRSGDSEYQEEQIEGRMYSAYREREPGLDAMSKHGRSFQEEEIRGNVKEFDRRTPGFPQRFGPRDIPRAYSEEPAKKKRKSRFSDATAEEIALAQIRHSGEFIHKAGQRPQNNPRGAPIRGKPPVFNNPDMDSGSTSRSNPNHDNVLDVLNDIEIENMEDAKYLKEKLCTVLREFQASKSSRIGGHTLQSASDHQQMHQHRDAYDDNLRDNPDGIYSENKGFQEVRRYEDAPRNFQESRQYEDDPRAFQEVRQYKDDPRDPRETRQYEDDSRDYREPRRFDGSPSDFPSAEARQYADDPRGFQKTRLQENAMELPERRGFDNDPRVKAGHYEEYLRASQDGRHHAEGLRGTQEAQYYGSLNPERKWDFQRRRSLERFEKSGPVHDRDFQVGFGNPPIHFQQRSLHEETRMYAGRGQRSHQDVRHTGDELYDPFHPSPSPPPEATNSTSLNKIASTLLELVARR